jgi:parallel beta-helix repeat protein
MRSAYHDVDGPRPSAGRWSLVVGIGLGLLTWGLLASGLASAQIILVPGELPISPISSCPVVISQPGSYLVTQHLTCPTPAVAITINASAVALSLGGHTISGGASHGIVVGPVTGVVISDGTIAGFGGYGLALDRTTGGAVARLVVTQTGDIGILASGVHNVTISGSTVTGPTYGGIVLANGASQVTISLNAVTNTRGHGGIVVADSTNNVIASNTATGNIGVTQTGDIALDLHDSSATCAGNTWFFNAFSAAIPPCIH